MGKKSKRREKRETTRGTTTTNNNNNNGSNQGLSRTATTPEEVRESMNDFMEHFNSSLNKNEPLELHHLFFFRQYAVSIMQNICGHTFHDEALAASTDAFPEDMPLKEELIPVTGQDKKFLLSVVKAKHSPIYVAHSLLVLGSFALFLKEDPPKAMNYLISCVEVCDSTTQEEKDQELPSALKPVETCSGSLYFYGTVGRYLADVRTTANCHIQAARRAGEKLGFSLVPGDQCDGCEAFSQGKPFNVCGRCRRAYYCSPECQKNHWKQTHKDTCRKRGEFRQGDTVTLTATVGECLDCEPVLLLEKDEDNKSWVVSSDDAIGVVSEAKLRVICPFQKRYSKEALLQDTSRIESTLGPVLQQGGEASQSVSTLFELLGLQEKIQEWKDKAENP